MAWRTFCRNCNRLRNKEMNPIYNHSGVSIYCGDCIEVLPQLPDSSVHCCVTSPPYWGLRDYGTVGQVGLEKTPEEYTERLVEIFREVRRVLRDDGTLWLNLGDSYYGSWQNYGGGNRGAGKQRPIVKGSQAQNPVWEGLEGYRPAGTQPHSILKSKDLIGIPWRIAFALQANSWYLRSDIIWSKPNPMPESVTDRPTTSHEHVFLFAKNKKYYYDHEAIKERATYAGEPRDQGERYNKQGTLNDNYNERNKRSVWNIHTQPFPQAHFAVFPEKLIEPMIKAGTSKRGCCPKCRSPYKRIVEKGKPILNAWSAKGAGQYDNSIGQMHRTSLDEGSTLKHIVPTKTIDWQPTCNCGTEHPIPQQELDADPTLLDEFEIEPYKSVPCTVLDPFSGAGTTLKVARDLGCKAVGIELNPEYIEMTIKRLTQDVFNFEKAK